MRPALSLPEISQIPVYRAVSNMFVGADAHIGPPIFAPQILGFPKEIFIDCLSAM